MLLTGMAAPHEAPHDHRGSRCPPRPGSSSSSWLLVSHHQRRVIPHVLRGVSFAFLLVDIARSPITCPVPDAPPDSAWRFQDARLGASVGDVGPEACVTWVKGNVGETYFQGNFFQGNLLTNKGRGE